MSNITGLSQDQVLELKKQFGENTLSAKDKVTGLGIFFNQFKSPLIYILLAVGLISFIMGEIVDGSLISLLIVVDVIMGFYQEYSAHKTLKALRKLLKPKAIVIREKKRIEIEISEIVPGDVVVLASGDRIPADGKLISGTKLLINEAILTGEEQAIPKSLENDPLFMGATVISGKGLMEATKIGQTTEIGKIGQSLQEIDETETPLEKRLRVFIKNIAWIILIICSLIFIFGILKNENIWETFKISIILAVAALPAALPIALTVILALGVRRILKKNGLIRKMLSIETLGSTSVICTDKTGTLTEGNMQVVKIDTKNLEKSLLTMTLDNDQKTNLEVALWEYVKRSGKFDPQEIYDKYEKIDEEPFDSEKKYSMTINRVEDKNIVHLMGAPEIILSFCKIEDEEKKVILAKIEDWADEGLRLLGLAYKEDGNLEEKSNFAWLGLVGIQDPIRENAKEAIEIAQNAGIKVKIVTGDYRKTAEKLAKNLGFKITQNNVIEGKDLEDMSDQDLKDQIENIVLFTRVLPHQKLKIVKALQEQGEVVAMTGDGVNDAPALKKSDIGVAVGSATDVAREASDLILLDSNFKTIVAACEEGRLILANIKKVVGYILSNSLAEIVLIFGAMLLNFSMPLIVVQILWIQIICDGPPDIFLSFEPKEKNLMTKKPQEIQKEKILSSGMKYLVFIISTVIGLLTLLVFWYFEKNANLDLARTIAFAIIASVSLIYIFSFKNLSKSIFALENIFNNKYLLYGVGYGFLLIFIAIYLPFFNRLLKTVPLNFSHWLLVLAVAIFVTICVEIIKFFENRQKI